jgi:hypothetical protein
MQRISFNPQFVNEAGNDLIHEKIHTIRRNYEYWKRFEGREAALFAWEGKARQKGSKQKVFCIKRIVSVQELYFIRHNGLYITGDSKQDAIIGKNDGFQTLNDFFDWFKNYPNGKMAILHFTDFRY